MAKGIHLLPDKDLLEWGLWEVDNEMAEFGPFHW
eukprot:CAMPEP_0113716830 /NCGR_PEP_ID=MMETSP0038_2-20120614/34137_1 /TAXON_ID=2898 /ORGANISM="Cryptomonas paramecium" /LENGTH=33 /DNA_ID=CAMNT_0000644455 /DNA_START=109 /DNA_END=207 /DNA_ORIENTATION=+ /assembly_acc=CAM_ASM_000170